MSSDKNPNWAEISQFKGPESSPGFLLWQVSSTWRRQIEEVLRPLALTHPQFVILANVGWLTREGGRASQKDLADQCKMDVATTSQVLRTLERKALVQRAYKDNNERSKFPSLTVAGKKLIEEAIPRVETADERFFKKLKTEKASLARLLGKLLS